MKNKHNSKLAIGAAFLGAGIAHKYYIISKRKIVKK